MYFSQIADAVDVFMRALLESNVNAVEVLTARNHTCRIFQLFTGDQVAP
jgi:hypothetical protein